MISGMHGAFERTRKIERDFKDLHHMHTIYLCFGNVHYTCFMCLWSAGEVAAAHVVAWYDHYAVPSVACEVRKGTDGRRVITQNHLGRVHSAGLIQIGPTHRRPLDLQSLPGL